MYEGDKLLPPTIIVEQHERRWDTKKILTIKNRLDNIIIYHLILNAKDKGTAHSGWWNKGYGPDLCFVTKDSVGLPPMSSKTLTLTALSQSININQSF